MTSFVSGDSVLVAADGTVTPLFDSGLVVRGSVNINTQPLNVGSNINILDTPTPSNDDVIYTGDLTDIIETASGNDVVNAGGGDDFIDGEAGNDILIGGDGDDVLKGGTGADVLKGGKGADTFVISGDPVDGAFGAASDLTFDASGEVIRDHIVDFNDSEDVLVLQDLSLEGGTDSVHYDATTGDVILTNTGNGDQFVVAELQPGLDIAVVDQGGGNYTLL